jgi:hypothetical protein
MLAANPVETSIRHNEKHSLPALTPPWYWCHSCRPLLWGIHLTQRGPRRLRAGQQHHAGLTQTIRFPSRCSMSHLQSVFRVYWERTSTVEQNTMRAIVLDELREHHSQGNGGDKTTSATPPVPSICRAGEARLNFPSLSLAVSPVCTAYPAGEPLEVDEKSVRASVFPD